MSQVLTCLFIIELIYVAGSSIHPISSMLFRLQLRLVTVPVVPIAANLASTTHHRTPATSTDAHVFLWARVHPMPLPSPSHSSRVNHEKKFVSLQNSAPLRSKNPHKNPTNDVCARGTLVYAGLSTALYSPVLLRLPAGYYFFTQLSHGYYAVV